MLTIRPAQWPSDYDAVTGLDTSQTINRVYRPVREALTFRLIEEATSPPICKRYEIQPATDPERDLWSFTALAEDDGKPAGFAAAQYFAWNRRVTLHHMYVDQAFRRLGVGGKLLAAVELYAQSVRARCLWLETQNTNYTAIQFYLKGGFQLCGFDESLYDPVKLEVHEIALFFMRPVPRQPSIVTL